MDKYAIKIITTFRTSLQSMQGNKIRNKGYNGAITGRHHYHDAYHLAFDTPSYDKTQPISSSYYL